MKAQMEIAKYLTAFRSERDSSPPGGGAGSEGVEKQAMKSSDSSQANSDVVAMPMMSPSYIPRI